jgi:flagellar biosynthesis protein FlhG
MVDQAESLRRIAKVKEQRLALLAPNIPFPCRVITITSGKGGVGKTNLAANLAIAFGMIHKRVLLMDADLGLPDINVIMGLIPPPRYNLYHVLSGRKKISEILAEGPAGVRLITGAIGVNEIANLSDEKRVVFIRELAELGKYADLIIIDTGAGLSSNILGFILAADDVILVTTPEPTAIADAYGMVKAIASERRDTNIKLLINRTKSLLEGKMVADRVINIVGQFLNMRVEKIGYVMEDKAVIKAVRRQKPFVLAYPKSKASNCVFHLRNRLARTPEQPRGLKALVRNILGIDYGALVF